MINDLLDYSLIRLGKFELNISKFFLEEVLEEIADVAKKDFSDKGLDFSIECLGSEKASAKYTLVRNDRIRLKQILLNIISSSIKSTSKGGIKIIYDISGNKESFYPNVNFQIKDTGCGLDEGKIRGIFNFFSRAENESQTSFNTEINADYGLAMCHSILQIMSPSVEPKDLIKIESKIGYGSTFSFTLFSITNEKEKSQFSEDLVPQTLFCT